MVSKKFTKKFKLEAIKQITKRHFPIAEGQQGKPWGVHLMNIPEATTSPALTGLGNY